MAEPKTTNQAAVAVARKKPALQLKTPTGASAEAGSIVGAYLAVTPSLRDAIAKTTSLATEVTSQSMVEKLRLDLPKLFKPNSAMQSTLASIVAASKLYEPPSGISKALEAINANSKLFEQSTGVTRMMESITASSKLFEQSLGLTRMVEAINAAQSERLALLGSATAFSSQFDGIVAGLANLPQFNIPNFNLPASFWEIGSVTVIASPRVDKDDWLRSKRDDLPAMRAGMWWTFENNPHDGLSQAVHSAIELVSHLLLSLGVREETVLEWAKGTSYDAEAIDRNGPTPRVTWRGKLRFAAVVAGFDDVGQNLVTNYGGRFGAMQRVKHHTSLQARDQVKAFLNDVEELVELLIG